MANVDRALRRKQRLKVVREKLAVLNSHLHYCLKEKSGKLSPIYLLPGSFCPTRVREDRYVVLTVGRSKKYCSAGAILPFTTISEIHCQIILRMPTEEGGKGEWLVGDSSMNGTMINGELIGRGHHRTLSHGDILSLSNGAAVFYWLDTNIVRESEEECSTPKRNRKRRRSSVSFSEDTKDFELGEVPYVKRWKRTKVLRNKKCV